MCTPNAFLKNSLTNTYNTSLCITGQGSPKAPDKATYSHFSWLPTVPKWQDPTAEDTVVTRH